MHDTESILKALENSPAILVSLVREAPPERLKWRPSAKKWSIHEHACHLAEVHPLFFSRLDLMLREQNPTIVPYNPDVAMKEGALLSEDLNEALERFVEDRRKLLTRLKTLSPEVWMRTAQHSEYAHYSVFIMFRHLAMHDMLHAYRIEELLLKPM